MIIDLNEYRKERKGAGAGAGAGSGESEDKGGAGDSFWFDIAIRVDLGPEPYTYTGYFKGVDTVDPDARGALAEMLRGLADALEARPSDDVPPYEGP